MSLYNMVHGVNRMFPVVMFPLGIDETNLEKIPRLRDAYIGPETLVVLTRTGGGNRPDYEEESEWMRTLPGYIRDEDDEFDSTFALLHYEIPEWLQEELENHPEAVEHRSLQERTEAAIQSIREETEE